MSSRAQGGGAGQDRGGGEAHACARLDRACSDCGVSKVGVCAWAMYGTWDAAGATAAATAAADAKRPTAEISLAPAAQGPSLLAAARGMVNQGQRNLLKCLALEPDANQQGPGLLLQFPGKPFLLFLARHAAAWVWKRLILAVRNVQIGSSAPDSVCESGLGLNWVQQNAKESNPSQECVLSCCQCLRVCMVIPLSLSVVCRDHSPLCEISSAVPSFAKLCSWRSLGTR